MLGVWENKNNVLYEFLDFDQVTLYQKFDPHSVNADFEPIKTYQYTISPSSRGKWSIFINDDKKIETGNLILKPNHLIIEMFNSQSGEVEKEVSLRRAY